MKHVLSSSFCMKEKNSKVFCFFLIKTFCMLEFLFSGSLSQPNRFLLYPKDTKINHKVLQCSNVIYSTIPPPSKTISLFRDDLNQMIGTCKTAVCVSWTQRSLILKQFLLTSPFIFQKLITLCVTSDKS